MKKKHVYMLIVSFLLVLVIPKLTFAEGLVDVKIGDSGNLTDSVKIFLLVFVLSIAPALFIMLTCFSQVIIVLGMTRQGLGTQTIPPNQVLVGLALFITLFIMSPVIKDINTHAYQPYEKGQITEMEALEKAGKPLKTFMLANTKDETIATMYKLTDEKLPTKKEDVSFIKLIPSYAISQITKGFITGLAIYGLFVFIDLIISSILMFLGMMMLPPQIISLPIKLLTFLSIGGFNAIVEVIYKSIAT